MATKTLFVFIFSFAVVSAHAQTFSSRQDQTVSSVNSETMTSGSAYSGTVYEPFTTATPSEQAQQEPNRAPGHPGTIRRDLPGGPESGQGPSPVGEPWIMVLFAALFAGGIALKRRKKA